MKVAPPSDRRLLGPAPEIAQRTGAEGRLRALSYAASHSALANTWPRPLRGGGRGFAVRASTSRPRCLF